MGLTQPPGDQRTAARHRLQQLVAEAEQLVELARVEADRIVAEARTDTTRKAEHLVAQAEELRVAAEQAASELLAEAEAERAAARAEADAILAEANRTSAEIIAKAKAVESGGDTDVSTTDEARREADRILRIAHAEAEARTAALVEEARRKVEQSEAEGRSRVEELNRTYRALQRQIRDEEMEIRARIHEQEERLALLEARPTPPPARVDAPQTAGAEEPAAAPPAENGSPTPARRPEPSYPWSIRQRMEDEAEDPDVLKALRAVRRRA